MTEAAQPIGVYAAIAAAIEDCAEGVKKNQTAGEGRFSYQFRGIDAVLRFMNPILARNKLMIVLHEVRAEQHKRVQTKKSGNDTYEVVSYCTQEFQTWRVYHVDGSFVQCQLFVENSNNGDKGPNACISIGWKYVAVTVFGIPVDDASVDDENRVDQETRHYRREQQRQRNERTRESRDYDQHGPPPVDPRPPARQQNNRQSAPPVDYKSMDYTVPPDGWARRYDGGAYEGMKLVHMPDKALLALLRQSEVGMSTTSEGDTGKRGMYIAYITRIETILETRKVAAQPDDNPLPESWGGSGEPSQDGPEPPREPGQEG